LRFCFGFIGMFIEWTPPSGAVAPMMPPVDPRLKRHCGACPDWDNGGFLFDWLWPSASARRFCWVLAGA
jgi:hypothetical protein